MAERPRGAILQRDKRTYAIVPRTPLGLVTPETLEKIAQVARRHDIPMVKLTSAQRIALIGLEPDQVEPIWKELGMDVGYYGVAGLYLFGSVKNADAGPCSDIDLLIHFRGSDEQRQQLETRLERWNLLLADINRFRTGYITDGLLDVHFVTDYDIDAGSSYAIKIGAVTDGARRLNTENAGQNASLIPLHFLISPVSGCMPFP